MRIIGRFCFSLIIFILIPAFLHAQSPDDENLNRVILSLNDASIPFERRSLLAEYGGFGSSLLIRSPGMPETPDNSPGTFVLAVPLSANFAVDTALALAKKLNESSPLPPNARTGSSPDLRSAVILQNRKNSVNIIVAFLGDEQNKLPADMGGLSHKGLRDLVTLTDMPENWVLCYFDAERAPNEMVIRHGIRGYVAPLDIVKPLPSLFNSRDIPWSFRIRYNEIYKLGLVEGPEPLFITWDEEINGFVLSGEDKPGISKTLSAEDLAELFLDYSSSLTFPVLKTDIHYSSFSFPGDSFFFLSEGLTVILLLITVGFLLLLFIIYSAGNNAILSFHLRLFLSHIWIFFILLPLLTVFIKASGLLYSLLLATFGQAVLNTLSAAAKYCGAGLTVLLAALVFFLLSPVLDLIRFPRRAWFYGFSSVIFIVIGMFIAAFLDFSYVPVFLWSFFFVFLGASIPNPILVFLCALLTPLFGFGALLNIFETGSGRIADFFISPIWNTLDSWSAAIQAALLSLPIFLLVERGIILLHKRRAKGLELKQKREKRLIAFSGLIVLILGTMVIQILLIPKSQIHPDRRFITETAGEILRPSLTDVVFQDSRILTLRLEARGNPVRFDVSLSSKNGETILPVYSAPVPFEREDEGKKISFSLGEYAPNPLTIEIVVPINFEGLLNTAAIYNTWDSSIDPGEKPSSDDYVLRVTKSLDLKSP